MIPENISTATVQQQDGKVTYLNCYGKGTGLIYTPTLSGLNENNPGLYDDNCIYGLYKDSEDVCSNLSICDGCRQTIQNTGLLYEGN